MNLSSWYEERDRNPLTNFKVSMRSAKISKLIVIEERNHKDNEKHDPLFIQLNYENRTTTFNNVIKVIILGLLQRMKGTT